MPTNVEKHKIKSSAAFNFPLVALDPKNVVATRNNQAFDRYLKEIGQYELLSREEVETLAIKIQQENDSNAAYRLVSANLRLVVKVALDFQKFWMQNFMDLIQEGNIGLLKAVRKFDPYKGVKFSYYATYWIRAYILKFLMNNWRLVKIGTTQAQRKLFFSLNKEKKTLEAQGYTADTAMLADRLGVKKSDIVEMSSRMGSEEVSLESPVREESESQKKDFIQGYEPGIEDSLCQRDMKEKLHALLLELKDSHNDKEQMILERRLLTDDPLTLQKISEKFDVSRERIRQIESNLLRKIRKYIEETDPEMMIFAGSAASRRRALAKVTAK